MTPERYAQINQLFQAALALAAEERADFVRSASAGDEDLLREANRLLEAHAQAAGFLEPDAKGELQAAVKRLLQDHDPLNGLPKQVNSQTADAMETDPLCGQHLGHYEIIRRIGAGGMGEVYLARDFGLDRQVALKILPLEFTRDPDRLHRFAREAKAASALNHPNIITIYEIGVATTANGELHFIATEFIEGQTLRQRLQAQPFTLAEALEAAIQTAAALNAAHQAGIIHRDIKPENLMLRPDGYLKVLDFGLARINKATAAPGDDSTTRRFLETHPGVVMGTLAYMSPEQARGERVDGRTDLWSLGVVLYELLTGVRPFTAATLPDLMVALLDREPAPLAQHLPNASPKLVAVVQKALAKDTALRFQTAQEFGQALKELRRTVDETAAPAPVHEKVAHLSEAPTRTFAKQPPVVALEEAASAEVETLPALPKAAQLQSAPLATPPMRPTWRWRIWLPLALGLALSGSWAMWYLTAVAPANAPVSVVTPVKETPERSLRYLLTVQKVRRGQDYEQPVVASESEMFENGWKFRFTFSSPQAGFVYVVNEGPGERGQIRFAKLFPAAGATSQLAANETRSTGNFEFDEHKGTEKVWLVWATAAVPILEAVKTVLVTDPVQAEALRQFLIQREGQQPESLPDAQTKQVTLRGVGETWVKALLLKHQ